MLIYIRTMVSGIAIVALVAGCSQERSAGKEYDIVGKVTAIADDKSTVSLDHEAIPGLMQGMEMKFPVASPDVVKEIQVGDAAKGKLRVQNGYTILSLAKIASAPDASQGKAAKIQAALAKLAPKDRVLAESQVRCPVTGALLGSMGMPGKLIIGGQPVFVCCDGCDDDARADPAKTLAKIEGYRKKKQDAGK